MYYFSDKNLSVKFLQMMSRNQSELPLSVQHRTNDLTVTESAAAAGADRRLEPVQFFFSFPAGTEQKRPPAESPALWLGSWKTTTRTWISTELYHPDSHTLCSMYTCASFEFPIRASPVEPKLAKHCTSQHPTCTVSLLYEACYTVTVPLSNWMTGLWLAKFVKIVKLFVM